MKRTLIIFCIALVAFTILVWQLLLAPPSSFYAVDKTVPDGKKIHLKLKATRNNSFLVYRPEYSMEHTGQYEVQSGVALWMSDAYGFWFWSGYGIKSLRVYSSSGQVLYDKESAYDKQDEELSRIRRGGESVFYVYYPRDWLDRDAKFILEITQGESPRIVMTDYLNNQFEGTINISAAR